MSSCEPSFRDCFSSSVHNVGQWQNCDMCVCENLDLFTRGKNITCKPPDSAKMLVRCQLSIQSDHSTGCRLVLTNDWVIGFSIAGVTLAIMMVFAVYNFAGWKLYNKTDEDD